MKILAQKSFEYWNYILGKTHIKKTLFFFSGRTTKDLTPPPAA